MQYYTYKITFKDLPRYFYYGKHKCNGKAYLGSPVTWAHLWSCFEPEVQILQWYKTAKEAEIAERSIITATWRDKHSLNENAGGCFSEETCRKNGKKNVGAMLSHPNSVEGRYRGGKKSAEALNSNPLYTESRKTRGKESAKTNLDPHRKKNGKKTMTADRAAEFGRTNAQNTNSQKWECLVTGKVSNPGNLTNWQKARGIDTSLRRRLEG